MPARPFCNLTCGRMPACITSASARGGYAQGGIGSERAGRPLRLSCQLVVGAQGVAYVAMKVALNSAVRPSLPHHQRLSVHPQKILGVHVARFESSSVASPRLPLRRASFGGLLASGQINRARGGPLLARAYLSNAHAAGEVAIGEPIHEPRKLRSSVFSRWKHGSNGMPWNDAQTASPLTLSVPAGSRRPLMDWSQGRCPARPPPRWGGERSSSGETKHSRLILLAKVLSVDLPAGGAFGFARKI